MCSRYPLLDATDRLPLPLLNLQARREGSSVCLEDRVERGGRVMRIAWPIG